MIKQVTQFKSVVEGVENIFHFDANCPTNIAKESLLQCLKWIGQIEDQVKAQQEAQKENQSEQKEVEDGEPAVEPESSV